MNKRKNQIDITAKDILRFVEFNTGNKKAFNVYTKKYYEITKMSKSQLIMNVAVIIQFFTGLRINEVAKLSFSQLQGLSKNNTIFVILSKNKRTKKREIVISGKSSDGKKLKKVLMTLLKDWFGLKQDFLVVSKNMVSTAITVKGKNGIVYHSSVFEYIKTFTRKINKKLKDFVEYSKSIKITVLSKSVEKFTTHILRNNYIVKLYEILKYDLSAVSFEIGHSSINITNIYISRYMKTQKVAVF